MYINLLWCDHLKIQNYYGKKILNGVHFLGLTDRVSSESCMYAAIQYMRRSSNDNNIGSSMHQSNVQYLRGN